MEMIKNIATAIPVGFAFGVAAHLSGVSNPHVIRAQFIFEKHIMFKMFFGALTASALSLAFLSYLKPIQFDKAREGRGWGDKGLLSAVIGGLIQGAGMAIAASCPGMAFAQFGAGVSSAMYTYLGGLAGASIYSFAHPWLKNHHVFDFSRTLEGRINSMHLERALLGGNYTYAAVGFAALTIASALALEHHFPWRDQVSAIPNNNFTGVNPIIAGLAIGALQLPTFLSLGSFLGASSGYSVTSSQVLRWIPDKFTKNHTYAKSFVNSKASWQIGLGFGIAVGASIASGFAPLLRSSSLNGSAIISNPTMSHVPNYQAFIGGILIVLGARITGGCASGHGLSGMPALHVISWISAPAIFTGAVIAGNILNRFFMTTSEYLLLK